MASLVVIAVGVALYFLPTLVAAQRKHRNMAAIVVLNILLGWTVLGWIGALIWSLTDNTRKGVSAPVPPTR